MNRILPLAAFTIAGLASLGCGGGGGSSGGSPPQVTLSAFIELGDYRVRLDYVVVDADSSPVTLEVMYSTDGGTLYSPATPYAGGGSEGLGPHATAPNGASHTFVWDAVADLGVALTDVIVRLRVLDPLPSGWASSATEQIGVNPFTSADITGAAQAMGESGTVTVNYTLASHDAATLGVTIEFSTDGGTVWTPCTEVPGPPSEGKTGLTSSPWGTGHNFGWDAKAQVAATVTSAQVRVTPASGASGTITDDVFSVPLNLQFAPAATITLPSGTVTQVGTVLVEYVLTDAGSEVASVVVSYSTDSGSTWTVCTRYDQRGTSPTTGLATSPAGITHTFVWDAPRQLGATVSSTMKVRVVATDADGTGPAGVSATFSLGNAYVWYGTATYQKSNVGSSRVDLQACKLEYSIVSPK